MKIDFHSSYKEINKLLEGGGVSKASRAGNTTFAKLIAEIDPKPTQATENTKVNTAKAAPSDMPPTLPEAPKASINWLKMESMLPAVERESAGEVLADEIKESVESVKKPTLLAVRRTTVEAKEQLYELPKDKRVANVKDIVDTHATDAGIDPLLGLAVISAESSFNPNAVSQDGHYSKGLFQLLDATGKELHTNLGVSGSYDPFNPDQNVQLGVNYLRRLMDSFNAETALSNNMTTFAAANSSSLEKLAVAAFNAGEGRVASAQRRAMQAGMNPTEYEQVADYLPESTRQYVALVMENKGQLETHYLG